MDLWSSCTWNAEKVNHVEELDHAILQYKHTFYSKGNTFIIPSQGSILSGYKKIQYDHLCNS